MPNQSTEKPWSGFSAGTKPKSMIRPGTYQAYLERITTVPTEFGDRLKLHYRIDTHNGPHYISELCSPSTSLKSKFLQRLQALNGNTITEDTDLGSVCTEGWCTINVAEEDGYPRITAVMPALTKK